MGRKRVCTCIYVGVERERERDRRKERGKRKRKRKREEREGGGGRERATCQHSATCAHVTPLCVHSPILPELTHFLHSHSKDEDVLWSHLLSHLHIGSIQGTNGQCTIRLSKTIHARNDIYAVHVHVNACTC